MNRRSLGATALALMLLLAFVVAGCGSSSTSTAQTSGTGDVVAMLDARTVIDVRTPAEYADGHIAGAQNMDVESGDFAAQISTLDKSAPYLVYCRSGRRSAEAAAQMAAAGFTDVVDGGGMADLVAAGAPTE
jgi:phage shock protein E